MNSKSIYKMCEDYIEWFYENRGMVADRWMNYGVHTKEYSFHLKGPRQVGHTTAAVELFKKYNAWYLYDRHSMLDVFHRMFGVDRSESIHSLNMTDRRYKGTSIVPPSVIIVDNYSYIDDVDRKVDEVMTMLTEKNHGNYEPIPIICLG